MISDPIDPKVALSRLAKRLPTLEANRDLRKGLILLLASDDPMIKASLRKEVSRLFPVGYSPDADFWKKIDIWLERPPLERCLAHIEQSSFVDALALLSLEHD